MRNKSYKLGTLSVFMFLAFLLGFTYFQKNNDTELLVSRLNLLEERIKRSSPNTDSNMPNEADNEIANLREKIGQLQDELNQMRFDSDSGNNNQKVNSAESLAVSDSALDNDKSKLQQESEEFNTIKNTGYLYEEDWKDLEQTLASMDKNENKLFWENMNRAIENNEIEIYSEK